MFCPGCGLEDQTSNQYCRACGVDMRPVRTALAHPDAITESAISARDEIGRAVAAKIRDVRSAQELSTITEDVLPEIEKFLESPAEKRLRRLRNGTVVSSIGLGATIGLTVAAFVIGDEEFIFLATMGLVCFFIGLGLILNGIYLTIPKKVLPRESFASDNEPLFQRPAAFGELSSRPETNEVMPSVTEHTTKHLREHRLKNEE